MNKVDVDDLIKLYKENLISAKTVLIQMGFSESETIAEASRLIEQRDTIYDPARTMRRQQAMQAR